MFVAVLYSVVWYTQTVLDSELQIMLEKEHERERLMGTYVLSICGAFTKLLLGFYALTITICRFVKLLFLCILAPRCLSSMDCATVGEHSLSLLLSFLSFSLYVVMDCGWGSWPYGFSVLLGSTILLTSWEDYYSTELVWLGVRRIENVGQIGEVN